MKRKDVHKPSSIDPADYEFVGMEYVKCEDFGEMGPGLIQSEWDRIQAHMKMTGGTYSKHQHGGNCHICGAWAVYTVLFFHAKTNSYIRTGMDCAEKLDMGDKNSFKVFRKECQGALKARAGKIKAKMILKDADLEKAWDLYNKPAAESKGCEWQHGTVQDIVAKLVRYGSISLKQEDFLRKLIKQIEEWPAIAAQRKAEKEAAADCPTGKMTVEGIAISVKYQDDEFSSRMVMTVKHDTGYLVWGTCPAKLLDEGVSRGDRVRFSATVYPSDRDPKFGFFKRPTKAEIITKGVGL